MPEVILRPIETGDRDMVREFTAERWRAEFIVAHGEVFYPAKLPGFAALEQERRAGLVTYNITDQGCEIVTVNATTPRSGVGAALTDAVKAVARERGCKRVWLITTNDNLDALRFYQRRDFRVVAVARNTVEESRKMKPEIPFNGIPVRDGIELEVPL